MVFIGRGWNQAVPLGTAAGRFIRLIRFSQFNDYRLRGSMHQLRGLPIVSVAFAPVIRPRAVRQLRSLAQANKIRAGTSGRLAAPKLVGSGTVSLVSRRQPSVARRNQ